MKTKKIKYCKCTRPDNYPYINTMCYRCLLPIKVTEDMMNPIDDIKPRLTALEEKVEKLEQKGWTTYNVPTNSAGGGCIAIKPESEYCECEQYHFCDVGKEICQRCWKPLKPQEGLREKIEEELLGVCWNPECIDKYCLIDRKEAIDEILTLIQEGK